MKRQQMRPKAIVSWGIVALSSIVVVLLGARWHRAQHTASASPIAYALAATNITQGPILQDTTGISCTQAITLPVGTTQSGMLNTNQQALWHTFQGSSGSAYEITSSNPDTKLELYNACGMTFPSFYDNEKMYVELQTDGMYYIKVQPKDADMPLPLSYTLEVEETSRCGGFQEPNNSLTVSHNIGVGKPQTQSICKAGDEDWATFVAQGGITYTVQAALQDPYKPYHDQPQVEVYRRDTKGNPIPIGSTTFSSPYTETYYIKVTGDSAPQDDAAPTYDLAVTLGSACEGDEHEPNNRGSQAKPIVVNGDSQMHTIAPEATDVDMMSFTAVAGQTYTIETIHHGKDADTRIRLLMCSPTAGCKEVCDPTSDPCTDAELPDYVDTYYGNRVVWTAKTSGTYYVEVFHPDANVACETTTYEVSIYTGACRQDRYEPDSSENPRASLQVGQPATVRNFCNDPSQPGQDRDWNTLVIDSPGTYYIRTSALKPGGDTKLFLYDTDGVTELARIDDRVAGTVDDPLASLAAQITYEFTRTGTYLLESRHFNLARYGSGTTYELTLSKSNQPPMPPPSPTSTPMPTPSPTPSPPRPESNIQTLIVFNSTRMVGLYAESRTKELQDELITFANRDDIRGEFLDIGNVTSVSNAYAKWVANEADSNLANETTDAIRSSIMEYLETHPNVQYIVLVGNDAVIPFRRMPDFTKDDDREQHYYNEQIAKNQLSAQNTTIGWALQDNMFLTDDFYADKAPKMVAGRKLHRPDYAIGRLIETPEEIMGMLEAFDSTNGVIQTNGEALVVGYDVVEKLAKDMRKKLQGRGFQTTDLIGNNWTKDDLKKKQLQPGFKLQFINVHATYEYEGAPPKKDNVLAVSFNDIFQSTNDDLEGAVIVSPGCHAGLNVPTFLTAESQPDVDDLTQAFTRRRACFISNTGYGFAGEKTIDNTEIVLNTFVHELLKESSVTIGEALKQAKQHYKPMPPHNQQHLSHGGGNHGNPPPQPAFDAYDEKVVQQIVLYGLPMYRLSASGGGTFGDDDPFPGVKATFSPHGTFGPDDDFVQGTLRVQAEAPTHGQVTTGLADTAKGLSVPQQTDWGSYVALDGHTIAASNAPVLPHYYDTLDEEDGVTGNLPPVHGAIIQSGTFYTRTVADPLVDRRVKLALGEDTTEDAQEPDLAVEGSYPFIPLAAQAETTADQDVALSLVMGQYDSINGVERLFTDTNVLLTFSASPDHEKPTIHSVEGYYNHDDQQAVFKVGASDPSGIRQVSVCYTKGSQLMCKDLAHDATTDKWVAYVKEVPPGAEYTVRVVDYPGNVLATRRDTIIPSVVGVSDATPTPQGPTPTPTFTPTPTPPGQEHVYLPMIQR